jgi:hypothetical protein
MGGSTPLASARKNIYANVVLLDKFQYLQANQRHSLSPNPCNLNLKMYDDVQGYQGSKYHSFLYTFLKPIPFKTVDNCPLCSHRPLYHLRFFFIFYLCSHDFFCVFYQSWLMIESCAIPQWISSVFYSYLLVSSIFDLFGFLLEFYIYATIMVMLTFKLDPLVEEVMGIA